MNWSPLGQANQKRGAPSILHGPTVFLDGAFVAPPSGNDVSAAIISHVTEKQAATLPVPNLSFAAFHTAHGRLADADRCPRGDCELFPWPSAISTTFHRRHIPSVNAFTLRVIYDLFSLAHEMRLQVKRSGASTLSVARFSACSSMSHLRRGAVSRKERHILQDTIRTLASPSHTTETRLLCALLTLAVHSSLRSTPVPILSAGSGTSKHPTQALLNVNTIRSELGYGERAHDRMCAGSACRQVVARPRQPHPHFLRHPSRIRHLQLFRLRNHSRPRGVVAFAPAT
ncbi:hypothetical protein BC826DRAFT_545604 [Russula brevipes]|nr:hypothetical protein BC826DRAFT_545604 [Russula brevipes]